MSEVNKQAPFFSYHVFLFPFKWEYKDMKDELLEQQTDLRRFSEILERENSEWEKQSAWYPPKTLVHYNEASYFYDFVRNALYDDGEPKTMLRHFRYKLPDDASYCISVKSTGKTYRLRMDDILLHVYDTGVGVLSFHLYNLLPEQSSPEDILKINQFGRRLYPPFFGTQRDKLGRQEFFDDQNWLQGLEGVKDAEMPDQIALEKFGNPFITENFDLKNLPPAIEQLPNHITQLFPQSMWNSIDLTPVFDDRMFVLCWYGNDKIVEQLKKKKPQPDQGYQYCCDDWWYKFIFIDGGYKTCQNDEMTVNLLRQHTNARWVNDGTLFGVSRYSFVCLTGEIYESGKFARIIVSHVQTMYYKMVELSLVQRACLLRFSDEVTEISKLKSEKKLAARISSIYRQYIRFVNKIYFREITAQEQGIELYDLLQQHMRLDRHVKDLDGEIQELHQYVSMVEEENRNENIRVLTYLGAIFLIPSFIAGYLGMNVFNEKAVKADYSWVTFICLILVAMLWAVIKIKGFWRWFWVVVFIVSLLSTLIWLPKLLFYYVRY